MSDSDNPPPAWLRLSPPGVLKSPLSGSANVGASPTPAAPLPPQKKPVPRLEDFVEQGKRLLLRKPFDKSPAVQWLRRMRTAIVDIFGPEAPLSKGLEVEIKEALRTGSSAAELANKIPTKVLQLESRIDQLMALGNSPMSCSRSQVSRPPLTREVFIIHGKDELNTRRLADMLQRSFNLVPVLMLAKPGMSRPLTNKFEDHAETCSFAFALLTPDDHIQTKEEVYCQARPNVIYEVGWFIGRLGRGRIVLLLKEGTRIHSDLDGVSQVRFADNVEERFLQIQQELQAARLID
jgi:predicted nucleotide-binding protein